MKNASASRTQASRKNHTALRSVLHPACATRKIRTAPPSLALAEAALATRHSSRRSRPGARASPFQSGNTTRAHPRTTDRNSTPRRRAQKRIRGSRHDNRVRKLAAWLVPYWPDEVLGSGGPIAAVEQSPFLQATTRARGIALTAQAAMLRKPAKAAFS